MQVATQRYKIGSHVSPLAPQFAFVRHSTQLLRGEQYGLSDLQLLGEMHSTQR
jgi:hypothetical protein